MDFGLTGKVAMVAGASRGLGYAVARALAAEGALVSIGSRDEAAIAEAGRRIARDTASDPLAVPVDLRSADGVWVGTLYNPGLVPAATHRPDLWGERAIILAPHGYFGAQAVVLSRAAVAAVLRDWDVPGLFDIKVAETARRHSPGVVLHTPSLVQHVPVPSACGNGSHRASNFDPFFRAEG